MADVGEMPQRQQSVCPVTAPDREHAVAESDSRGPIQSGWDARDKPTDAACREKNRAHP